MACTCGFGGLHDDLNPRCERNIEGNAEFEVEVREGKVNILVFEDNDDLEAISLDPESAVVLAEAIYAAAREASDG